MQQLLTYILTIFTLGTFAQTVKEMQPTLGFLVDKSVECEIEFLRQREICEKVWNMVSNQSDFQKLSQADKEILDNCDESNESYWDILGGGCSWYCGG